MQKTAAIKLVFIFLIFLLFQSCKEDSGVTSTNNNNNNNSTTKVRVSGTVYNDLSNEPLDNASIRLLGLPVELADITDSEGNYSISAEIENQVQLHIIAAKSGYSIDTVDFVADGTTNITIPDISLNPSSISTIPTGKAASIGLISVSPPSINVIESGGVETTTIIFQVLDSLGNPIDLVNAVTVNFALGGSPNGNEYLHNASAITDGSGRVAVNLNSGTRAGVVQVMGIINIDGKTIQSRPVPITIHGGLPDLNHFSLAPFRYNFPALDVYGKTLPVSVILGDKYGNPVIQSTAAYFTTTSGVIQGSTLTNADGLGQVLLYSGEPRANHPIFGPGFADVTAYTVNENNQTISRTINILFSGIPQINVTPSTFDIANLQSQFFNYTVMDENGNPLCGGTNIKVEVDGQGVVVQGDIDVVLPDTKTGWTQFNFVIQDTSQGNVSGPLSVKISVNSENGLSSRTIFGTGH